MYRCVVGFRLCSRPERRPVLFCLMGYIQNETKAGDTLGMESVDVAQNGAR